MNTTNEGGPVDLASTRTMSITASHPDNPPMTLRQAWIDGSDDADGVEFHLTCGAGVGSPFMHLTVKRGGQRRTEIIDIRPFLTTWVTAVLDDMDNGGE